MHLWPLSIKNPPKAMSMKQLFLLSFFTLGFTFCQAQGQTVDVYVQIHAQTLNGRPCCARIQTGANPLVDSLIYRGEMEIFLKINNNPINVLNKLSLQGWKLVSTMLVPERFTSNNDYVSHCYYILKKEVALSEQDKIRLNTP
jgi:hypothetical protein